MSDDARILLAFALLGIWTYGLWLAAPMAWRRYKRSPFGEQLAILAGVFLVWALAGRDGILILFILPPFCLGLWRVAVKAFHGFEGICRVSWRMLPAALTTGWLVLTSMVLIQVWSFGGPSVVKRMLWTSWALVLTIGLPALLISLLVPSVAAMRVRVFKLARSNWAEGRRRLRAHLQRDDRRNSAE